MIHRYYSYKYCLRKVCPHSSRPSVAEEENWVYGHFVRRGFCYNLNYQHSVNQNVDDLIQCIYIIDTACSKRIIREDLLYGSLQH